MNFQAASREQLLQIALFEECDIRYKYQACKELSRRK